MMAELLAASMTLGIVGVLVALFMNNFKSSYDWEQEERISKVQAWVAIPSALLFAIPYLIMMFAWIGRINEGVNQ